MSQKIVRGYLNVFRVAGSSEVDIPFYSFVELSTNLIKPRTYLSVGTELLIDDPHQEKDCSLAHQKVRVVKALFNGDPGCVLMEHMKYLEHVDLADIAPPFGSLAVVK